MTDTITGFFSYAHVDWEADRTVLSSLFDQIEAQIRAATGSRRFEKWQDVYNLRWGQAWRDHIHAAIASCELFFLFLSPGWLNSAVCREELAAFLKRETALGGGERLFVAQIRDIPADLKRQHADLLAELDRRQQKRWRPLLDAKKKDRTNAIRTAGEEVAARLRELAAAPAAPPAPAPCTPAPPPVSGQPLVSGFFHIPSAKQGGEVDGRVIAGLRLLFAGWARQRTRRGCFVFGVTSAWLRVDVTGGALLAHDQFGTTRKPAVVTPRGCGRGHSIYSIAAKEGLLLGNVLSENDEHVPLLWIERDAGKEVTVSGHVEIEAECVVIDEERSVPEDTERQDDETTLGTMRKPLAALILEEHGRIFPLEGFPP